mgnify:FL=1|jgi:hypothetical protein
MIYLNGEIGAVYLNGHYHSEVYLGGTLVWSGVKKIPGEAGNKVAFANTASGVTLLFVSAAASAATKVSSYAKPEITALCDTDAFGGVTVDNSAGAISGTAADGEASDAFTVKSTISGIGVVVNKQERKEHIEITQPSPNGTEITLNPNNTGEKFNLFQSVPTGHGVVLNPILFAEGLSLSLPVPPGTATVVNKITGSESVKLAQPTPTGDDVLFANGTSANSAFVKNSGKASIGDCVGGKSDGAVSAKNSAIPEFLSSVPASQMSALKAVSDTQPQQIGLVDMLSILGMKMLWRAEAAAIIPWEYPVQNGDVLSITQVYSAIQNGETLEVT